MGFSDWEKRDAIGFTGGIWVLWNSSEVKLDLLAASSQFLHFTGRLQFGSPFLVTAVYGNPSVTVRNELWEGIRSIAPSSDVAWLVAGDFNAMKSSADKRGGAAFSIRKHQPFLDCCADCDLNDLNFSGPRFTWYHGTKRHRIDRAMCNTSWIQAFPESKEVHLPRMKSDHRPILITSHDRPPSTGPKPFRFMAGWLQHKDFLPFLARQWDSLSPLPHQLAVFTPQLKHWNKTVFGNIFRKKEDLLQQLAAIEAATDADAMVISRCIDEFASLSGQSVSREKSKLYFSKNVGTSKQGEIGGILGIPITINLGRVDGMSPPKSNLGADVPTWGLENNGAYSVKSGYLLIAGFQETALHVLRDCPVANNLWRVLIPPNQWQTFFGAIFEEWWWSNVQNIDFSITFGLGCWLLWKARNQRVFTSVFTSTEGILAQLACWKNTLLHCEIEANEMRLVNSNARVTKKIAWEPLPSPWAELRAIVDGLHIAWNWGARKVIVQTDSLAATILAEQRETTDHQHAQLVMQIQELLQRDWEVKIAHIFREGNFLAGHLAGRGHSLPLGTHSVEVSDSAVATWIAYDRLRSSQPRLVLR
ncbi:Putative ribonuclease H protein At1g65750 [Linum grandiflorum]